MTRPTLKRDTCVLASLLFCIISLSLFVNDSFAQSDENYTEEPKIYKVGTYILNVGKIDLQTGTYDLDFYLWVSSDDENFVESPPKIEFMNGKATIDPIKVEPNYYEVRIKGNFQKNMNFKNYPFEQLQLTIEIEGIKEIDKLQFVVDDAETGIDGLVNIPGWNLKGSQAHVTEHEYSDNTIFSRYVFSLDIERFPLSSFLKTIFPVLIITTIAMLAFWMSPTNFTARIGLGASTLLAAVAAHLNAAGQLPPIGYLTLMDKIMIIAYSLFLNNLLSMVIQMRYIDHKKEKEAEKINSKMRKMMPIIIIIIFFALFFA